MPRAAKAKKSNHRVKKAVSPKLPQSLSRRSKLPSVWKLSQASLSVLWQSKWLFLSIVLAYGIVNLAVAQGFSSGLNVTSAKNQLSGLFHGHGSELSGSITIYALMLSSLGGGSSGSGFGYSLIFAVLASLAIIWTLRNRTGKVKVSLRDAYYRGVYPLIPFLGILLIIGLELIPMVFGITLYITAVNNTIAVNAIERLGFISLMIGLSFITL